jgi:hypothetical protein
MSMLTKKRSAAPLELGEEQQHLEKRNRLEETTTPTPLMWKVENNPKDVNITTNFTHIHLQILKVLYRQATFDQDDGAINDEHWKSIEYFLQKRQDIKTMAAKVRDTDAIQAKSRAFEDLVQNLNFSESHDVPQETFFRQNCRWLTNIRGLSMSSTRSPSSMVHPTTRTLSARFFSGTSKFGSASSSYSIHMSRLSGMKQQRQLHRQESPEDDGNPFGIISCFLKHKQQLTFAKFQQTSAPLRSLVKDVEARIKCLTAKLEEIFVTKKGTCLDFGLADQTIDNNDSFDVQSLEEARVEVQTKLELWRLLLQDSSNAMELTHRNTEI